MPPSSAFPGLSTSIPEDPRFAVDPPMKVRAHSHEAAFHREGELITKLHTLIHSPLGECITRIVDELHGLLPQIGSSS